MTTVKEIITSIKAVLKKQFEIMKLEVKMLRNDVYQIHIPTPDKVKSFPHCVGNDGHEVFVPMTFGPEGIDLTINLNYFEEEYGPVSDQAAVSLAVRGLLAYHEDSLSEVRAVVDRDYVTDDYIRSYIRLNITLRPDVEFIIDPWFHIIFREGNTIVVSIDADVVYDVYRDLETENDIMDLD